MNKPFNLGLALCLLISQVAPALGGVIPLSDAALPDTSQAAPSLVQPVLPATQPSGHLDIIDPAHVQAATPLPLVTNESVAAPPAAVSEQWSISAGESLSAGLSEWCKRAGWRLVWHLPQDWSAPADTEFTGSFLDAARQLTQALSDNGSNVWATAYMGNKVLVVEGTGDSHDR